MCGITSTNRLSIALIWQCACVDYSLAQDYSVQCTHDGIRLWWWESANDAHIFLFVVSHTMSIYAVNKFIFLLWQDIGDTYTKYECMFWRGQLQIISERKDFFRLFPKSNFIFAFFHIYFFSLAIYAKRNHCSSRAIHNIWNGIQIVFSQKWVKQI